MVVFRPFVLSSKFVLFLILFCYSINLVVSRPQPSFTNRFQASSLRDSCVSELLSKSIAVLTVAGLATSLPSRVRAADASQADLLPGLPGSTQALAELSSVEVAAAFIRSHCTVMLNAARTTGRVLYRGEPIFLSQGGSSSSGQRPSGIGGRRSSVQRQSNDNNSTNTSTNNGGDNSPGSYNNEDVTSAFSAMMDKNPLLLYAPPDLLDQTTYGNPLAADFFNTISLALEAKATGTVQPYSTLIYSIHHTPFNLSDVSHNPTSSTPSPSPSKTRPQLRPCPYQYILQFYLSHTFNPIRSISCS